MLRAVPILGRGGRGRQSHCSAEYGRSGPGRDCPITIRALPEPSLSRASSRFLALYVQDQWPLADGACIGATLRRSDTRAVATMNATMIAWKASAKASVAASR